MISIKDKHPLDNAMCKVQTIDYLPEFPGPWRFVRSSDGMYHWDDLYKEILQDDEVTHWEYYNEENK